MANPITKMRNIFNGCCKENNGPDHRVRVEIPLDVHDKCPQSGLIISGLALRVSGQRITILLLFCIRGEMVKDVTMTFLAISPGGLKCGLGVAACKFTSRLSSLSWRVPH